MRDMTDYLGYQAQALFPDPEVGDAALRIISSIAKRQARHYDWLAAALSENRVTLDELIADAMADTVLITRDEGWRDGQAAVDGWRLALNEFYRTLEFVPRRDPKDPRILRDRPDEVREEQMRFMHEDTYDFIDEVIDWDLSSLSDRQREWVDTIARHHLGVTEAWREITGEDSPRSHTNWLRKKLLDTNPLLRERLKLVQCGACRGKARNCKTCASVGWTTADGERVNARG